MAEKLQDGVAETAEKGRTDSVTAPVDDNTSVECKSAVTVEFVAVGTVEEATGKKKRKKKKRKKVAPAAENSSVAAKSALSLGGTGDNSQLGTINTATKATLSVSNMAAEPASTNAQDTGSPKDIRNTTDSGVSATSYRKIKNKLRREARKGKKFDDREPTSTDNQQSALIQQPERSISKAHENLSVTDKPTVRLLVIASSSPNPSVTGNLERVSADQMIPKTSESTFESISTLKSSLVPVAPVFQRGPANTLKKIGSSKNQSESAKLHVDNMPRERTSPPHSLPDKGLDLRSYVASLNVPGISYDKFGVCIAPDAPQWVRGRIARRVQILVSEREEGILGSGLDQDRELEIEKKEKTFFGQNLWNDLYKIDLSRKRESKEWQRELSEVRPLMEEFDKMIAAELLSNKAHTMTDSEPIEIITREKVAEMQKSMVMPTQLKNKLELQAAQQKVETIKNNNNNALFGQPLNPQLPVSFPPVGQTIFPTSQWRSAYADYGPSSGDPSRPAAVQQQPRPQPSVSRPRHSSQGSRLCLLFQNGKCHYGKACKFLHVYKYELEDQDVSWPDHYEPTRDISRFSYPGSVTVASRGTHTYNDLRERGVGSSNWRRGSSSDMNDSNNARAHGYGSPSQTSGAPSRMSSGSNSSNRVAHNPQQRISAIPTGPRGGWKKTGRATGKLPRGDE